MSLSLHDASVPVFLRYLAQLRDLVSKAERFATERGVRPSDLLAAKLAPDMLSFERQVAIAANFTLRAAFPLAGEAVPTEGTFPETFEGLHARIDRAALLLGALEPSQFVTAGTRVTESRAGEALVRLSAPEFLFQYALPNFFFHFTAAYAVLRHQGVPLGKQDFDGFHRYTVQPSPR
ncbi:DUF1993 domain-containing protein [Rhodoferax sp. GW822-FHT02A01]|uniref:DUF1993 domain-containing protein n=1 Tax=Rhodoferax sp. GW822-FHT02A01 TaxID=3141537 RepID=UPI00315C4EE6